MCIPEQEVKRLSLSLWCNWLTSQTFNLVSPGSSPGGDTNAPVARLVNGSVLIKHGMLVQIQPGAPKC